MRLGSYPCDLKEGTIARNAYGDSRINDRHRHRYELNNDYRESLAEKGLSLCGTSPDDEFVEIVEISDHPFFVATQFHPEFQSTPLSSHPLFRDFVQAALKHEKAS